MILNDQEIDPMPVITGNAAYPEGIIETPAAGVSVRCIDALKSQECGNIKAVNIVLIGLLARTSSIPKEIWLKSIEEVVPQRFPGSQHQGLQLGEQGMVTLLCKDVFLFG